MFKALASVAVACAFVFISQSVTVTSQPAIATSGQHVTTPSVSVKISDVLRQFNGTTTFSFHSYTINGVQQ